MHLLREVLAVRQLTAEGGGDEVELLVRAVPYGELAPLPGILTDEPLAEQGLESRLPNGPVEQDAAPDARAGPARPGSGLRPDDRLVVLRVTTPRPGVIRLRMGAAEDPDRSGDAEVGGSSGVPDDAPSGDGMLLGAAEHSGPLQVSTDPANSDAPVPGGPGSRRNETLRVRAGRHVLVVETWPFAFSLQDGEGRTLLAGCGRRRQVAGFALAPALALGEGWAALGVELGPDEHVVGLGEQFGALVRDGCRHELVADDALGVGTGLSYKAAPIWHSTAGWSVLVHTPGPLGVDVGGRYPGVLTARVEGDGLDLFVLLGSLAERLGAYAAMSGGASLPPRWAFGVWMSRCRYRSRAELEGIAAELRRRQVPTDVLHIDPDWLERDLLNCDFVWSDTKYPDPAGMIAGLHADGFRVSVWVCPYLDPASPVAGELERAGLLVAGADGSPARARVITRDASPRYLVDFSNPAARRWWAERIAGLVGLGVDVVTCDFGEGLPDDAVMADGRTGRRWRNLYPLWYSRATAEALAACGRQPPLVWSRSGWIGSQRYPAQWGGDPEASVAGLAASIRGGLSWSLSAPGLWSHDVGGFYGAGPSDGLYVRWAQAGCLAPLTRFHGLGPREPWAFGPAAEAAVRAAIDLRYQLVPYLQAAAADSIARGLPMMRALLVEFPDQPALAGVDHEWLLGSDLLAVAVLDDDPVRARARVVLPAGTWVDWFSGEMLEGPLEREVHLPLDRFPLYVRGGAVIPCAPPGASSAAGPDREWHLRVVPGPLRTTAVSDGERTWRYRPVWVASAGGPPTLAAVEADEPEPRARSAHRWSAAGAVPAPLVGSGHAADLGPADPDRPATS